MHSLPNPHHSVLSGNTQQADQTAVDYFILRLSELEFRVRQTENYIKYADELKELRGKEGGKRVKTKEINALTDKIDTLERKSSDFSERVVTLESKFLALDRDLRQHQTDFESKYVS